MIGIQGIAHDITERRRAKTELSESEAKFRGIAERSFDIVATLDQDDCITYVSPAVVLLAGYLPEEMIGKPFRSYISEGSTPKAIQVLGRVVEGGVVRAEELEFVRKGGSTVNVEVNASPMLKTGNIVGVQVIIRDVSERFKLAEMRNQFISAVTHELRTPLVSVKGYVDLALSSEPGSISKEVESQLQVVKRNTDRLLSLVDDLLDVQRLQAGRLQLSLKPMDFRKVMDSSIAEIQPALTARKLSLRAEAQEAELLIQGDEIRLCQVMMNLLSNAVKFSPEGGEVTFHVEEEKETIKVYVSDKGIGIKQEDLKRVFEPFSAIQKTSYVRGTGLGLSITKGLIEAHGGQIWAESPGEEKGATFTFTIPKGKREE